MNMILHPELVKILHGFWYRFRFLSLYIVIGVLSLLLELSLRSQLLFIGFHVYLATSLSLVMGILFAFFGTGGGGRVLLVPLGRLLVLETLKP